MVMYQNIQALVDVNKKKKSTNMLRVIFQTYLKYNPSFNMCIGPSMVY